MYKGKILCVDDESNILSSLRRLLRKEGFEVFLASSGKEALSTLSKKAIDIALIDYLMPEMNGIELIREIKKNSNDAETIMVTAYGDVSLIVKAMKAGANDYILKPWDDELLISVINRVLKYRNLLKEKIILQEQLKDKYKFENLIGSSLTMEKIFTIIKKVKESDNNILIQGESGTGKEQIARAIHFSGKRSNELFIPVDCISINPNIIESELFGHVKGAFTGAYRTKEGLLKAAGKGTLFLDEIAEIPPNIQAKLLRAIQDLEIRPVGGRQTEKIEARIIAATNRDIHEAIEKGEFREDLYYRLNVVSIKAPPLREHKEDIPLLVSHFIKKFNTDEREIKGITSKALKVLMEYSWPGNIRELENCISRVYALGTENLVNVKDLPEEIFSQKKAFKEEDEKLKSLAEVEREHIIKTIMQFKGNKSKSALFLKISKGTIFNKIKKYNINL